jgi:glycosyltransferase involved in cell wall biosynthesis
MPQVSAIIAVYNGAATVAQAIDSVLAQTFGDLDLIVVNDGSTDGTPSVLRSYGDRIRVVDQPNRGVAAARNAGVRASRGEYIAFLDSDDAWAPTKIARAVAALEAAPSCVLAFSNLTIVDSAGHRLSEAMVGSERAYAPTLDEMLARLWPIMPTAIVVRREALDAVGGFCEEFRSCGHYDDVWFCLRVREHGPFVYLPEPLGFWRFSLFPRALKKSGGGTESTRIFTRLVRERYGVSAAPLIRSRHRAPRSIFGFIGLNALRDGDTPLARMAFRRALSIDPLRIRNYLRFMRTFLPQGMARALSGRTGR